ncbi:MAG TPA: LysR substrate-binding domain-containing protein [Gammaproteobacteria bacterium]|nr:LysR substrate-binding domain-containing protein [Gammaproteobacteria bacterium]
MKTLPPDWFLRVRLKMRHLQLFVALDEHRNIHRAASTLGMSQPAASKLLGELENMLEVTLFERQPRGVVPNWYGEILIRHARIVLAELHNAGDELTALNSGHGGTATVGTVDPAVSRLSCAIDRLHRRRPDLQFAVDVDVSHNLIDGLLEGQFDFVLARIPEEHSADIFLYEEIGEEDLCFVCRDGHPLCDRETVTIDELAHYTWAVQPHDGLLRQRVDALLLQRRARPPRQIVNTRSPLVSITLVDKSDVITVMSREVARFLCHPQRFHILPFPERISVKPYGLVRLRGRPLSPGATALMETFSTLGDGSVDSM